MTGSAWSDMVDGMTKRCGKRAPDSLAGERDLRCMREVSKHGWHQGDHKTHVTKANVGKLTITWKQGSEYQPQRPTPPPVVKLPIHQAVKLSRLRCTCEHVRSYGSRIHSSTCPLAGGV